MPPGLVRKLFSGSWRSSLRIRLFLLVLVAIVPALALILYTGLEQRRQAMATAEEESLQLARRAFREQQRLIDGARQLLTAVARVSEVLTRNSRGCQALFADILQQFPAYANLGAATLDGDVFCSVEAFTGRLNIASQPHFREALRTRQLAMSGLNVGAILKTPIVVLAKPAVDAHGTARAVALLAIKVSSLQQVVAQAGLPQGSRSVTFDSNGAVLVGYPELAGVRGTEWPWARRALGRSEGVIRAPGVDGVPCVWGFAQLQSPPVSGLYVAVGIPEHAVLATATRVLTRNLTGLLIVVVLTFAVTWAGGDLFLRRRVRSLVTATRRLASGDLRARTGLPHETGELGQLARAFDEMVESLEHRQAQLGAAEIGRYSAERALEASEQRLHRLVESVHDYAIYMLDAEGRVVSWNAGAERLTGFREEEALGSHVSAFFMRGDAESDTPARLLAAAATHGRAEDESWLVRKDGTPYRAHTVITPIVGPDGRLTGFATVTHDITQRARAEADLIVLNAVIAAAGSSLELSEAIAALRTALSDGLRASWGRIFLCEGTGATLWLATSWGAQASEEDSFATAEYRRRATEKGAPIVVQDYACIPLVAHDQIEGLLEMPVHAVAESRANDVLLTAIGREIGVAFHNIRLHRQVRATGERLERLSRRLLEVQETERRGLARELHDEIGQALTSVKIDLQALKRVIKAPTLSSRVDESIEIVSRLLQQVRDISLDLRPSLLDDWGLVPALRWYVERHAERAGIAARLMADDLEARFPPDVETACFRIVQEALTNAVRHAKARHVDVRLRMTATVLEVVVHDDGAGFDVPAARSKATRGTSMGLLGMEERARLLGGTLDVTSARRQGTEVRARFPLRRGGDTR